MWYLPHLMMMFVMTMILYIAYYQSLHVLVKKKLEVYSKSYRTFFNSGKLISEYFLTKTGFVICYLYFATSGAPEMDTHEVVNINNIY